VVRRRKKKEPCPVCGKLKADIEEHIRICHPDYKPSANEVIPGEQVSPLIKEQVAPDPSPDSDESPALDKGLRPGINYKKTLLLILGGIMVIAGGFMAKLWMDAPEQSELGIIATLIFGGGGLVIYLTLKRAERKYTRPSLRTGGRKFTGDANSITIFAKKDPDNPGRLLPDKIEFEKREDPPGLKRKLRNDGKYYAVNVYDTSEVEDCVLPDSQYCDPRLLKDAVEMKCSREYYTPEPTLFQKIKPVIFIVIIVIGAIILMMVGNPPAPGS
jgi:hypothetical protein